MRSDHGSFLIILFVLDTLTPTPYLRAEYSEKGSNFAFVT